MMGKIEVPVASYNVHQCVGLDGRREPARIAEILRTLECPIIGLQEVSFRVNGKIDTCQLQYFAHATKMDPIRGATRIIGDSCYGNVLLTTYPVLNTKLLDLTIDGREPRGAIEAILRINSNDVRVVVTHLGLRSEERRRQIQKLIHSAADPMPTILLGDLNEWVPMSRAIRWIQDRFGRASAPRTFPSNFPLLSLDRIWSSHTSFIKSIAYRSRLTRVASDHLPVRGTVLL